MNGIGWVMLLLLGLAGGCSPRLDLLGHSAVGAATLPKPAPNAGPQRTFGAAADAALATLERRFYVAPGRWNMCVPGGCGSAVRDWGADALTYTLFLRWKVTHDASIGPIVSALTATAPTYGPCTSADCRMWSDVPLWDSIAAAREFEITRRTDALAKAAAAFALVDRSNAFALGACPTIDYQRPGGGKSALKTLETDSNYIKAALILWHWTSDRAYIHKAIAKYAAVRRYFLDPILPLYTTYVFDDGKGCAQLPGRFFASVNGNMIYSGLTLAALTGNGKYSADAVATAQAVVHELSDAAGNYADLQAENDVAEPLVEAMYDLATERRAGFARTWLLANAQVAEAGTAGAYGRFFAGPPPTQNVSAWSANGGLALAIAAGALEPQGRRIDSNVWQNAHFVNASVSSAPASIVFTGSAISLIGSIGDVCCEPGHVRVFIDGRETTDRTGIWQNKSPAASRLPDSSVFSWRWPASGRHMITFEPGLFNPKEGGSYIHLRGYKVVR